MGAITLRWYLLCYGEIYFLLNLSKLINLQYFNMCRIDTESLHRGILDEISITVRYSNHSEKSNNKNVGLLFLIIKNLQC